MKQLVTSTTISLVDYKNNYTETNNLLILSGKSVITNPKLTFSGQMVLDATPKFQLVRAYSADYIEVASDTPFYIKIIVDEDFDSTNETALLATFGLRTARFSYNNREQPIIVAIGNGSMDVDPIDGRLVTTNNTKEQGIEFVISSHSLNYTDTDFTSFSSINGGTF